MTSSRLFMSTVRFVKAVGSDTPGDHAREGNVNSVVKINNALAFFIRSHHA